MNHIVYLQFIQGDSFGRKSPVFPAFSAPNELKAPFGPQELFTSKEFLNEADLNVIRK
jgi:hypothetical protein